jgi:hypothetical protein
VATVEQDRAQAHLAEAAVDTTAVMAASQERDRDRVRDRPKGVDNSAAVQVQGESLFPDRMVLVRRDRQDPAKCI